MARASTPERKFHFVKLRLPSRTMMHVQDQQLVALNLVIDRVREAYQRCDKNIRDVTRVASARKHCQPGDDLFNAPDDSVGGRGIIARDVFEYPGQFGRRVLGVANSHDL